MNIKVRLEPKFNSRELELIQKMKKAAEKKDNPEKEKTLDQALYGEEQSINELIPGH